MYWQSTSFAGSGVARIREVCSLHDRILVRIEEQGTTSTGIIIPDAAKDKPKEGEALAVGKGEI